MKKISNPIHHRKPLMVAAAVCAAVLSLPGVTVPGQNNPRMDSGEISRGKYIVDHVAMCGECHTPRNEKGEIESTQYLGGAPIPVKAPAFIKDWAFKAPALTGMVGYTTGQGIRLLMDGITADGRTPSPPMPPFRMNRRDAEAVVTYLQSLK